MARVQRRRTWRELGPDVGGDRGERARGQVELAGLARLVDGLADALQAKVGLDGRWSGGRGREGVGCRCVRGRRRLLRFRGAQGGDPGSDCAVSVAAGTATCTIARCKNKPASSVRAYDRSSRTLGTRLRGLDAQRRLDALARRGRAAAACRLRRRGSLGERAPARSRRVGRAQRHRRVSQRAACPESRTQQQSSRATRGSRGEVVAEPAGSSSGWLRLWLLTRLSRSTTNRHRFRASDRSQHVCKLQIDGQEGGQAVHGGESASRCRFAHPRRGDPCRCEAPLIRATQALFDARSAPQAQRDAMRSIYALLALAALVLAVMATPTPTNQCADTHPAAADRRRTIEERTIAGVVADCGPGGAGGASGGAGGYGGAGAGSDSTNGAAGAKPRWAGLAPSDRC